jgi:hypothetical protein
VGCGDIAEGLIERAVGQDSQNRPKDLVLHDGIVQRVWIDDLSPTAFGFEIFQPNLGEPLLYAGHYQVERLRIAAELEAS